jgi:hypothetical protein
MNILFIILLVILTLVAIFLLIALFPKKDFRIEREIIVNKHSQDVFNYIKYLGNHHHFSKWTTKDPTKSREARGIDGTPGFVLTWDNYKERAGIGELEIKKIIEGERIDLEHRYLKPIKGMGNSFLSIEKVKGNQTRIKWVYNGISNYPINLITALLDMEKLVGGDLEIGLGKLKSKIEN